jgi:hypothetical protein
LTRTSTSSIAYEQHFPANASFDTLSVKSVFPFPLGQLEKDGGISKHGFFSKKFLGLNNRVIGSAGMTG